MSICCYFLFLSLSLSLSPPKVEIVAGQFQSLRVVLSSRARYQKIPFLSFILKVWHPHTYTLTTTYIIHDGIVLHHAREKESGNIYIYTPRRPSTRKKGRKGSSFDSMEKSKHFFVFLLKFGGLSFLQPSDLFLIERELPHRWSNQLRGPIFGVWGNYVRDLGWLLWAI